MDAIVNAHASKEAPHSSRGKPKVGSRNDERAGYESGRLDQGARQDQDPRVPEPIKADSSSHRTNPEPKAASDQELRDLNNQARLLKQVLYGPKLDQLIDQP